MRLLRTMIGAVISIAGIGVGLWYAPEINPVDHFLFERAHPVSKAQLDDPALLANVRQINSGILYQQKALLIPQDIPVADCRLMVQVIRDENKSNASDETLLKNTEGRFNCPFADLGLRHFDYPKNASGDEKFFRSSFIGRPSYSLFRTRFSIVYGDRVNGIRCTYNRLTGHWKRETCHLVYDIDPVSII